MIGFVSGGVALLLALTTFAYLVAGPPDEDKVTVLKALYFGMQTVTTIGYGSSLKLSDDLLRGSILLLMLLSAVSFGLLISSVFIRMQHWLEHGD